MELADHLILAMTRVSVNPRAAHSQNQPSKHVGSGTIEGVRTNFLRWQPAPFALEFAVGRSSWDKHRAASICLTTVRTNTGLAAANNGTPKRRVLAPSREN